MPAPGRTLVLAFIVISRCLGRNIYCLLSTGKIKMGKGLHFVALSSVGTGAEYGAQARKPALRLDWGLQP